MPTSALRSPPTCRSTSATRAVRGSAAATKTPRACSASTSQEEPTSRASPRPISTRLPCDSINVRERPWASKPQPISYKRCCTDRLNSQRHSGHCRTCCWLDPVANDPKRTRAKSRRPDTTSQDQAVRRDARHPHFSISSCHCAMDSKFRIVAACDAEQLIDHDLCLAALDGYPPKSTGSDAVRHPFVDILGDADRGAELLVQSLDSRSNIHAIAHHGIAHSRAV